MRGLRECALCACAAWWLGGCASQRASAPPPSASQSSRGYSYDAPQSVQSTSAQPAPSVAREQPGASYGETQVDSYPTAAPPPSQPSTQAGVVYPSVATVPSTPPRRPTADDEARAEDERRQRGLMIEHIEQRLRAEAQRLTDTREQCRDVCMAAGNICVAAQEICRLTGDTNEAHVADVRCARARSACAEAGVTRDTRCPVCPPVR